MEQRSTVAKTSAESEGRDAICVTGRAGERGHGPFMYITLELKGSKVARATFETYGCPSALRCGDWVTKWAVERQVDFLLVLEPADLGLVVGGLPATKQFCAEMTVKALRDAIAKCGFPIAS